MGSSNTSASGGELGSTVFTAGDCPVCASAGALIFVTGSPRGRVVVYCPTCECAWPRPTDARRVDAVNRLSDLGVRDIRAAKQSEIDGAGFTTFVVAEIPAGNFPLA